MTYIFVYGTLKKAQPNHHHMTRGTNGKGEYCGQGHTVEKYPLVIAGKYNIPYLLNIPGSGCQVSGEIYAIDDQLLQFLDEFESCPHMYQRALVNIKIVEWCGKNSKIEVQSAAGSTLECFVYSTTTYQPKWIDLPYYENYDAWGKHGLKYVECENRD
ncbi:gamma-glutamylaminecyclotransferase isoform X2 [Latimeria chalumnae]|nr:PREDICTED: gamma-glutamylaminecyclotransferase isoform X2 [Latimeria chalumnae]|eukprot:XP_005995554.1 PREDICTED: gamma-glutamylaminecyclotransferase isoform X2 [Latimeria chalumnae]